MKVISLMRQTHQQNVQAVNKRARARDLERFQFFIENICFFTFDFLICINLITILGAKNSCYSIYSSTSTETMLKVVFCRMCRKIYILEYKNSGLFLELRKYLKALNRFIQVWTKLRFFWMHKDVCFSNNI